MKNALNKRLRAGELHDGFIASKIEAVLQKDALNIQLFKAS
jgi:hypothetical protein